jgi:hypothetical protein
MDDRKLERILMELVEDIASDEELQASLDLPTLANARARGFEEARVLTEDRGIVLTLADGSEFQITIVQSGGGEEEAEDEV